jgi:hypothetical protein
MKKFPLRPAAQLAGAEAPARTTIDRKELAGALNGALKASSLSKKKKAGQVAGTASEPVWQDLSDPEAWKQAQYKARERADRQRAAEDEARAQEDKKPADIYKEKHLQALKVMLSGPQPDHICFGELEARAASGLHGVVDKRKWQEAFEGLIRAGLLVSDGDQGFSREAVQEVLPLLKAEGLVPGQGLVHWLGQAAGDGAEASKGPEGAAQAESRHATESKKRVPKWLSDALKVSSFWDLLERGIALSGGSFVIGHDCSAHDVANALKELDIVDDWRTTKTIADAVRASRTGYVWTCRSSDHATATKIAKLYQQGKDSLNKANSEDVRGEDRERSRA